MSRIRLNLLVVLPLILASCASDEAVAQTPSRISYAGIYDIQTHQASAVVAYEVKSYGAVGKLHLDLLGFAGSTVGSSASITGGSTLAFSYPVSFGQLSCRASLGPAFVVLGNDKPHFGLFGGFSGSF